mgnify:CR=1 FL=1
MTTTTTEQKVEEKKEEESKVKPSDYSCQILLEDTTLEKANDKYFPTDAFNVTLNIDGKERLDVIRSEKMVNVFDMYYDQYGKDAVQKIDYGHGTIRPNLWGNKPAAAKKKRRK